MLTNVWVAQSGPVHGSVIGPVKFRKQSRIVERLTKYNNLNCFRQREKYGNWKKENDMRLAINALKNGSIELNECARLNSVPKATISRHMRNQNEISNDAIRKFEADTTFSNDAETELGTHIPFAIFDIRKPAYDLA
ncbi:hypothetical protein JTB14_016851 [Gonioctena quinquepunctata]|nr:hypothetical protein JTB14_016851 [Gonioctena quinquepunctata]